MSIFNLHYIICAQLAKKIKYLEKSKYLTDNVPIPSGFIIGQFALIFKLKELTKELLCHTLVRLRQQMCVTSY